MSRGSMADTTSDSDAFAAAIQSASGPVIAAYRGSGPHSPDIVSPELLTEALQQFGEVMRRIEATPRPAAAAPGDAADITELGDYGLGLLQDFARWAEQLGQEQARATIDARIVPLALWVARHGGTLNTLEPVVNTLAARANQTLEPAQLVQLCTEMGEIILAAASSIRQDLDKSNPGRPWRILNLNRAIVATRSHDPALMERVFAELVSYLPDDAADFFSEGMRQMDALDYPPSVREVMQNYHHRYTVKALH